MPFKIHKLFFYSKFQAKLLTLPQKWLALAVTCSCLSLIFFNVASMPIAIPSIASDLLIPNDKIEWVMNVYFLVFATLILPVGRLTDIFGVRHIMSCGFPLFALGSLIAGLSMNFNFFFIGRGIQGIGAALIFPAMGAHLVSSFEAEERGKALGLNTGISSFFWIFGPMMGGLITQYFSWRYLMLFNIPITCFGLFISILTIAKKPKTNEVSFDFLGAFFLALLMGSLTIALMQGSKWGWTSSLMLFMLILASLSTICFLFSAAYQKEPIINLAFFRLRSFTIGTLCACFSQMISMIVIFWALYMQNNLHFTPTLAGGLILLSHVPVIFSSPLGGYLGDKCGVKLPIILGFLFAACGLIWLTVIAHAKTFWPFIPPLVLFGIGQPLILAPCYSASMDEIIQDNYAAASGIVLGLRQLSLPLGMAILSAFYSLMQKKNIFAAFRTINFMAFILAIIGLIIAYSFFPKKAMPNSHR